MEKRENIVVQNLIKIMNKRELTKISFANLIGFPEAKWNKIANGKQGLGVDELSIIAEKLQMREIDIYTYPEEYVTKEKADVAERISVTFEVSPDKRDVLLKLVTGKE